MPPFSRDAIHVAGVEGARPYGAPPGSVPAGNSGEIRAHARGAVPYVSDTPFVQAYADRPKCRGHRTDGEPCGAKARPGMRCCKAHAEQE